MAHPTSEATIPASAATVLDEPEYRRITELLRRDIVDGVIAPGAWLRLHALAPRFGVSVQPIREALQVLQGEGLIEFIPNRGARAKGIDRQRIIHIYEIREAMKSFLSRRFAEEASLSDLRKLEVLIAQHDEAIAARDVVRAAEINRLFHHTINSRSGNDEALSICDRYLELAHKLFQRVGPAPDWSDRIPKEHHALLEAFHRRDGQAAMELSARHIQSSLATHLSLIEAAGAGQKPSTQREHV